MNSVYVAVEEEIALEGLDGITLDALWFRLSERLNFPLPLHDNFKRVVWKLILARSCYQFFEINENRVTPKRMDRRDYFFNTDIPDEVCKDLLKSVYYIYDFAPVEGDEVRGSCREFKTRKKLKCDAIKDMAVEEVEKVYEQKFVIVASQSIRNAILIPSNIGRECDINNQGYCVLERIGRSRCFGEATSGQFSLSEFLKDHTLIHYYRNSLCKNHLITRQHFLARVRGAQINCQVLHLPRFYTAIQTNNMVMTERLFDFLKKKPNHTAEIECVTKFLNIKLKSLSALVKTRPNIFIYHRKRPYRECYPNATEETYLNKNKTEKMINFFGLVDPNIDIFTFCEPSDDLKPEEETIFNDITNQKFNRALTQQVFQKIIESGKEGVSQCEIGKYFGLSRLNARSVIRRLQREKYISSYLKDEGRHRISKFVAKDVASYTNKDYFEEISRLYKNADTTDTPGSETKISIPITPEVLMSLKTETPLEKPAVQISNINIDKNNKVIRENPSEEPQVPVESEKKYLLSDNAEKITANLKFVNDIYSKHQQNETIIGDIFKKKLSQKVLTRITKILEVIKEKNIIELNILLTTIRQHEADFKEEFCKKSMARLCRKLATDNFLKIIELELKSIKKTVKIIYVAQVNITFDMDLWNPIIEEQKIQHFISHRTREFMTLLPKDISSAISSNSTQSDKKVEFVPKFMKMKLFHEFLFYLIYVCPKEHKKIPIKEAIEIWSKENPMLTDLDEISEKITNCYSTNIGWKLFVTPLNPNDEYKTGWGLLRDIIHRIPLNLFVKIARPRGRSSDIFSSEFHEYLNHPIKCNYLLHFLPWDLREQLFCGRKGVLVIHELCKKLCYCGLLQFGPSRTKEIDQAFIYLNKNASLWDTRSSKSGYLKIEEKEYPIIKFNFDSEETVMKYWDEMYEIATNTDINHKSVASEDETEIGLLSASPEIQKMLKAQTPTSVLINDDGKIPGDHKGAAGLDKAFMVHMNRNWKFSMEKVRTRSVLSSAMVKSKTKKDMSTVVKETAAKIISKTITTIQARYKSKPMGIDPKSKVILKKNFIHNKKVDVLDAVDKEAKKSLKTMRLIWSDVEDKTLLMIKVAMKYVFPHGNKTFFEISPKIYRDILHWRTEKALTKTAKNCFRRLQYLSKSRPLVREQIILYLEELNAIKSFRAKYENLFERVSKIYPSEYVYDAIKIHIVEMVHIIQQIFFDKLMNDKSFLRQDIRQIPSDYDLILKKYSLMNPSAKQATVQNYRNPETTEDIKVFKIMTVIHSAVCCSKDKKNFSYHLFEVYKKFDDYSLNLGLSQLRRASVVTSIKRNKSDLNLLLPQSTSPFHLSARYSMQISSGYVPVELYDEYYEAVKILSSSEGSYKLKRINCGWIYLLAEMISSRNVSLKYDMADKLVMIDPALRNNSKFMEMSENYQRRLDQQVMVSQQKKNLKFSSDDTLDEIFLFKEDPIEYFFKIPSFYLHLICALHSISKNERISTEKWSVIEERCSLKYCIVQEIEYGNKFLEISKETQDSTHPGLDEESWLSDYKKISRKLEDTETMAEEELDSTLIRHSKMLTQLKEFNVSNRTADSFVVNFSTVYVNVDRFEEKEIFEDININKTLTPFNEETRNLWLKTILDSVKWKYEELESRDLQTQLTSIGIASTFEIIQLSEICSHLQTKKCFGATVEELLEIFCDKHRLQQQIKLLMDKKIVLRVGVETIRFVHKEFASYWLIDTFTYIREKQQSADESKEPSPKKIKIDEQCEPSTSQETTESHQTEEKSTIIKIPFFLHSFPWIRVNGTLNRRVFDKWLGTILNYLSTSPCTILSDLCNKFNILTPFEIRNLCEILETIGCVRMTTISEAEVDLFSDYASPKIEPTTYFCPPKKINIEICCNAFQRLAFFIGRKKYKTPFI
ncbi:CLUMA_CG015427, isoform A [Clunio marinus]|uniref:CLUMA_CG015427, isoform A n=1 Tax=Clunio marinus TaxID=568069 RepID=A0A1J1IRK1_9DIPT|nr:CLUMA_CG015427, isoform A [Clunio marinus]